MNNSLTLAEIEALMLFLAHRSELWERHAEEMGLLHPMDVPKKLARAHARVISLIPQSVDKKRRLCTDPSRL